MIGSGVSILATIGILRVASHRIEFDADAFACRLAARTSRFCEDVPKSRDAAAIVLARALRKVSIDSQSTSRSSWLHPSVDARVAALLGGKKESPGSPSYAAIDF
jgi:Zn-dependent protease with chaperone function